VSMFEVPLSDIHVLSLGTTDECTHLGDRLDNGGLYGWARHAGADALLRAQTMGTFHAAEHLIGPGHITRINAVVPKGLFRLDRASDAALRGRAEDVSRRESPRVAALLKHNPRPYVPLHTKEAVNG
jgi:hypothetical protein